MACSIILLIWQRAVHRKSHPNFEQRLIFCFQTTSPTPTRRQRRRPRPPSPQHRSHGARKRTGSETGWPVLRKRRIGLHFVKNTSPTISYRNSAKILSSARWVTSAHDVTSASLSWGMIPDVRCSWWSMNCLLVRIEVCIRVFVLWLKSLNALVIHNLLLHSKLVHEHRKRSSNIGEVSLPQAKSVKSFSKELNVFPESAESSARRSGEFFSLPSRFSTRNAASFFPQLRTPTVKSDPRLESPPKPLRSYNGLKPREVARSQRCPGKRGTRTKTSPTSTPTTEVSNASNLFAYSRVRPKSRGKRRGLYA